MLLAFMGPGIIAANAGNDAGGIATYASAGAQFGYRTLFAMVLVTVALVVVQVSGSRWRWLALGYPVLTLLAVVVTANHFWLDGIAAALLLGLALAVQRAGRAVRRGIRSRWRGGPGREDRPDYVPARPSVDA